LIKTTIELVKIELQTQRQLALVKDTRKQTLSLTPNQPNYTYTASLKLKKAVNYFFQLTKQFSMSKSIRILRSLP